MIGLLLLIISVVLYIKKKKAESYLIFIVFATNGLRLLTEDVIGGSNSQMAILYVMIICIYSHFFEKNIKYYEDSKIRKWTLVFILFTICVIFFSYIHYGTTTFQAIRAAKSMLLLPCYFFIRKTGPSEITKLIKYICLITIFCSLLYILQVITGLPFLPYNLPVGGDSGGLLRFYNFPEYLDFSILFIVLYPKFFTKKSGLYLGILIIALLCTQGRTLWGAVILSVTIALFLLGKFGNVFKYFIIGFICCLPLFGAIESRLNSSDGNSDISAILAGSFVDVALYDGTNEGTMAYRFAWIFERGYYIVNRPVSEIIFGLGTMKDGDPQVSQYYNFKLGLWNEETGAPYQMGTPDIAYGNILIEYGFAGLLLFILLWRRILFFLWNNRKDYTLGVFGFSYAICLLINSFSGSVISNQSFYIMIFIILTYISNTNERSKCSYSML